MSTVILVGETDGSGIKDVSQQVAGVAAGMGEVIGLVIGKNVSESAMKLAAGKVVIADDERLEYYDPVKYASIVSQVVQKNSATKVLMGATTMGKDLGPRVAAELGWGYLGDCLEASNEGFVRPDFSDERSHAFYRYSVLIDQHRLRQSWSRDRLVDELNAQRLYCGSGICPEIYLEGAFKNSEFSLDARLPMAKSCGERSIQFPVDPTLSREFQEHRVQVVRELLKEAFHE